MKTLTKILILIPAVCLAVLLQQPVAAQSKAAQRYLDTALQNCDRGMRANWPRSPIALRVLQRYQKKYRRYKKAALKLAPALENSADIYDGDHFTDQTYQQVIIACDTELALKIEKAEAYIEKRREQVAASARNQANTRKERAELARSQAIKAIDTYCLKYHTVPTLDTLSKDAESRLGLDKTAFEIALKKAEEVFERVEKAPYTALMRNAAGELATRKETVAVWKDYCADLFDRHATTLEQMRIEQQRIIDEGFAPEEGEDDEGFDDLAEDTDDDYTDDEIPPDEEEDSGAEEAMDEEPIESDTTEDAIDEASEEEPIAEDTDVPVDEESDMSDAGDAEDDLAPADEDDVGDMDNDIGDDMDAGDDEMLVELRAKVKGDRLKVLKDEGRSPDFTNDDDNPHKADTWQFEIEDGDNYRCHLYKFSKDKLKGRKIIKSECPG